MSMHFIWLVFIGFLIGLVARFFKSGGRMGFILTTTVGILGSVVASEVGRSLGLYAQGEVAGFIASVIGAIALLAILQYVKSK